MNSSISQDGPITLVVGDLGRNQQKLPGLSSSSNLTYVDISELSAETLNKVKPEIVLSALFVKGLDAIQIAKELAALDYQGWYWAVANDIPNVKLVTAEVSAAAPNLKFSILNLPLSTG